MKSGDLTDLDNSLAPAGSTLVTISAVAFCNWMKKCRYTEGIGNPGQEVFFIKKLSSISVNGKQYEPNWHITAMLAHRVGGNCQNFHFKVEMAKASSHYWHYVVHELSGHFFWVGSPGPLIPHTNEGGGGAGANHQLLIANRTRTETAARSHQLDGLVTKKTQAQMMRTLRSMIKAGTLTAAAGQIS